MKAYQELTVGWYELSYSERQIVIRVYQRALKLSDKESKALQAVFSLITPDMILGRDSCRIKEPIDEQSIELLIKDYL